MAMNLANPKKVVRVNNEEFELEDGSHEQKQKGDLDRQTTRLTQYAVGKKYNIVAVLSDVGSGMSSNRARLKSLFNMVEAHEITKVVIEHKQTLENGV